MADIELDNHGEDGREEEDRQEEDTFFTESTDKANTEFDNIWSQINSEQVAQNRPNIGLDEDDLTEIGNYFRKRATQDHM